MAGQLGCTVGREVGYKIRFDDSTTEGTFIKFMTDGILLREMQVDPELRDYSIVMVDEAHERSINIDFLLGLLKDLVKKRADLKLVISSATIEEKKFSQYFSGAPIINVSGRMYPVEIYYQGLADGNYYSPSVIKKAVIEMVEKIHSSTERGDILVFMTGEDDISATVQEIKERGFPNLVCFPLYGNMSFEDQMRVFEPIEERKVVVATNIAETSVTIDGIAYVIDAGYVKQTNFHSETGIRSLDIVKISKASAMQRAGRAGRTQPGMCYRLYSQEEFDSRDVYTLPEIQRTDLAGIVLQMRILGIVDVENFDFIDPPDKETFHNAHETLVVLGALDENNGITKIGELMARLPLEPRLGRMIVAAQEQGCINEISTIAASLSTIRSIFIRPRGKEEEADRSHQKFRNPTSDFITFLNAYKAYEDSGYDPEWCHSNFLNTRILKEVRNIREQLLGILRQVGISPSSSGNPENIAKAVAAGLVQNLCQYVGGYQYDKKEEPVFIHPGSSLFGRLPAWIVAADIVVTTNTYARNCGAIEGRWIEEIAPHLCKKDLEYLSYNKETDKVEVIEHIYYNGYEINQRMIKLEGRIAKEIQAKRIAEAEKKGWLKLSFTEDRIFWRAQVGESKYIVSLSSRQPKEGKIYYCSKKDEILWEILVNIEFEVFDFS